VTALGDRQLDLLRKLCSLTRVLVTPDKVSASLVRRGLLRETRDGAALCISPDGLRAIADAMEAGRVYDAIAKMLPSQTPGIVHNSPDAMT
jgi:hypothetical protein